MPLILACLSADAPTSIPETPDLKKPITAQERQREREEKRRRRQERAREKEKKQKEKERREKAEGFGGLILSENDKNLLERWTRMIDQHHPPPLPGPPPTNQNPTVPKPDMRTVTPPLSQRTVFGMANLNPITGNLNPVGNPNSVSGNPNSISGNPSSISGNPNSIAANLNPVATNPNSISANLNSISGNPNSVAGNFNSIVANLNPVATNPNSVAANTNSVSGNFNSIPSNLNPVATNLNPVTTNLNPVPANLIPEARCRQNGTISAPSVPPNIQFIPRCLNPCPVPNLLHYVPPNPAAFQIAPVVLAPTVKQVAPPIAGQLPPDVKFISSGQVFPTSFATQPGNNPTWSRGGHQESWPAADTGDGKRRSGNVDPALFLRNPTDIDQPTQAPGMAFASGADCHIQEEAKDLTPLRPTTFNSTDPATSMSPDINLVTQQFSKSQVSSTPPPQGLPIKFDFTPSGSTHRVQLHTLRVYV